MPTTLQCKRKTWPHEVDGTTEVLLFARPWPWPPKLERSDDSLAEGRDADGADAADVVIAA
jgi:hypothetical protein